MKAAKETDFLARAIRPTLVNVSTADESHWRLNTGALTYKRSMYVPRALRSGVTRHFHNNPESGHFVTLQTAEHVSRDFHLRAMDSETEKYIAGGELCHRIIAPRHA